MKISKLPVIQNAGSKVSTAASKAAHKASGALGDAFEKTITDSMSSKLIANASRLEDSALPAIVKMPAILGNVIASGVTGTAIMAKEFVKNLAK